MEEAQSPSEAPRATRRAMGRTLGSRQVGPLKTAMEVDPQNLPLGLSRAPAEMASEVAARLPRVYTELKAKAHGCLRRLPPGQSVAPTELVHETYLKLTKSPNIAWNSDEHFVMAAAIAMRQIAIDRIRKRVSEKRGGGAQKLTLEEALSATEEKSDRLALVVDAALAELESESPRGAQLVTLRFFLGMTEAQAATALNVSERTVRRDWVHAKAWLSRSLNARGLGCSPAAVEGSDSSL